MNHSAVEGSPAAVWIALGGGVAFMASLALFLVSYGWGFEGPRDPSSTIDSVLVDLALFSIFALHHSLLARTGIKAQLTRILPAVLERSAYVWVASLLFAAVVWWWQPVPGTVWQFDGAVALVLRFGQLAGVILSVLSAKRLDALDLAGLRQVLPKREHAASPRSIDSSGTYAIVRHPIYFGWLLIVWLAPEMNGTRLAFAAISTLYLVVAIPFEERDLVRTFGGAYREYQRTVRWRMVPGVY